MIVDEACKADAAVPITAMAFDLEQVELADKLGEGDRTAAAHSRNPNPVSLSTNDTAGIDALL